MSTCSTSGCYEPVGLLKGSNRPGVRCPDHVLLHNKTNAISRMNTKLKAEAMKKLAAQVPGLLEKNERLQQEKDRLQRENDRLRKKRKPKQ